MLVKFKTTWLEQDVYVNPQYVVSMRQASHTERLPMPMSGSKLFFIAGQVDIDFPVTYGEGNRELHTARVLGTLDEVAMKLKGIIAAPADIERQLFDANRAGAAEAWFGAATHPGLPSDIADAFHMAARRMMGK